jgi:hypothetical protein
MESHTKTPITRAHVKDGFSYEEYRLMGKDLLSQNKTTGPDQSEKLLNYSKLNDQRMDRLDKTVVINDDLKALIKNIKRPMVWVVLTELWCGDAAQNLPAFAKMAAVKNGRIWLSLSLRDENPELMDAYLTNGSRSIPKLIALDSETMEELFVWGPRPKSAQQIMLDYRAAGSPADVDYKKDIQVWYIKNHTEELQQEFAELIKPYTE